MSPTPAGLTSPPGQESAPRDYDLPAGTVLFGLPLLTDPGSIRIAVRLPVISLHQMLLELADRHLEVEHIYDC